MIFLESLSTFLNPLILGNTGIFFFSLFSDSIHSDTYHLPQILYSYSPFLLSILMKDYTFRIYLVQNTLSRLILVLEVVFSPSNLRKVTFYLLVFEFIERRKVLFDGN